MCVCEVREILNEHHTDSSDKEVDSSKHSHPSLSQWTLTFSRIRGHQWNVVGCSTSTSSTVWTHRCRSEQYTTSSVTPSSSRRLRNACASRCPRRVSEPPERTRAQSVVGVQPRVAHAYLHCVYERVHGIAQVSVNRHTDTVPFKGTDTTTGKETDTDIDAGTDTCP